MATHVGVLVALWLQCILRFLMSALCYRTIMHFYALLAVWLESLTLWRPLLPYWMGTARPIKRPVPDRVKPSFIIFDIRAWVSQCPDVKNYNWRHSAFRSTLNSSYRIVFYTRVMRVLLLVYLGELCWEAEIEVSREGPHVRSPFHLLSKQLQSRYNSGWTSNYKSVSTVSSTQMREQEYKACPHLTSSNKKNTNRVTDKRAGRRRRRMLRRPGRYVREPDSALDSARRSTPGRRWRRVRRHSGDGTERDCPRATGSADLNGRRGRWDYGYMTRRQL